MNRTSVCLFEVAVMEMVVVVMYRYGLSLMSPFLEVVKGVIFTRVCSRRS